MTQQQKRNAFTTAQVSHQFFITDRWERANGDITLFSPSQSPNIKSSKVHRRTDSRIISLYITTLTHTSAEDKKQARLRAPKPKIPGHIERSPCKSCGSCAERLA